MSTLEIPGKASLYDGTEIKTSAMEYISRFIADRMPERGSKLVGLKNRILIVRAGTGAGKSSLMPVSLFRLLRDAKIPLDTRYEGKNVLVTQPRILTCINLAIGNTRVWPDMKLGVTTGYITGPAKESPYRGLVYTTIDTLNTMLSQHGNEAFMDSTRILIIDEVHEQSVHTELVLARLRRMYTENAENANLPHLIITSATFEPRQYAKYFGVGYENIVLVQGMNYPIKSHFLAAPTRDYAAEIAKTVAEIDKNEPDPEHGDVLVFLPGASEMKETADQLARLNTGRDKFKVLTLIGSGAVGSSDYKQATMRLEDLRKIDHAKWRRRVILSTVVAETGITIDTLGYVIDVGWDRSAQGFFPQGYQGILTVPESMAKYMQRRGRVGRKFAGEHYPMMTEATSKMLPPLSFPDAARTGIDQLAVEIFSTFADKSGKFDVRDIILPGGIPADTMRHGLHEALILGFSTRTTVTPLGRIAAVSGRILKPFLRAMMEAAITPPASPLDILIAAATVDVQKFKLRMNDKIWAAATGEAKMPVIGSDYIDRAVVFRYLIDTLHASGYTAFVTACRMLEINGEMAIDVVTHVADALGDMTSAGISFPEPATRMGLGSGAYIKAMRHVLFRGLRAGLLTWDARATCYRSIFGDRVKISKKSSLVRSSAPFLVTHRIDVSKFPTELLYSVQVGTASVVDEPVDTEILSPTVIWT